MRELRFRAWVYYGDNLKKPHYSRDYGSLDIFFEDHSENSPDQCIEQYTGLKDKNGKEIYEGDILHSKVGIDYVVSYSDDKGRYEMWSKDGYGGSIADAQYIKEFNIEVIGNIHENPELLGDTNITNKEEECEK